MVLSDRVARPPSVRGDRSTKPRRRTEGPFSGMNRTVANVGGMRRAGPSSLTSRSVSAFDGRGEQRQERQERQERPERRTVGGLKGKRDFDKKPGQRRYKALEMQRALTNISYEQRGGIKARMQQIESFDQLSVLPAMAEAITSEALKGMVDVKPTPVQRLAIPALLGQEVAGVRSRRKPSDSTARQEFLIAAETGSGKTLAYLVPTMNAMKQADVQDADAMAYAERLAAEKKQHPGEPLNDWIENFEPHPNTARPRVVVLVPTAELVQQVTKVAKALSHVLKLKVRPLSADFKPLKIRDNLYHPTGVDLIVSTPHLLASIAESDPNILSRVSHLVIDEADSLLDRSFAPVTTKIVERAMPSLKQLILCSATIPKRLDKYLVETFPDIRRITTPNLHAIPRRVQLGVVDVSQDPYRNNKNLACADAIWSIGKEAARHEGPVRDEVDVKRVMVFVNERETTQEVASYLQSKGIDAVALHRDSPEHRQSALLASFTTSDPMTTQLVPSTASTAVSRRSLPNTKVMVATDLASRGIDTLAVRHVILYDVPHTTIDFIHRLGRAGRMGRRGRGVVLVGKDDRRDIVSAVKESMFRGQALV